MWSHYNYCVISTLLVAVRLVLATHIFPEGPESCVRNISVEQFNISVRYEIHLDQQCSLGTSHLWTFHVVSCDTDEKLLEVYSTTEVIWFLSCPLLPSLGLVTPAGLIKQENQRQCQ
nr:uncharacterized protein LOC128692376 [Cherax quadricarinatus]